MKGEFKKRFSLLKLYRNDGRNEITGTTTFD